jgi:two-component system NtrC family response regulator
MPTLKGARDRAIAEQEKKYLNQLLVLSGGNIKKCCETSGLSRSRLYDLLKKYRLSHK